MATSNDITVTKFLDQKSNDVTVTKFLDQRSNDVTVTKFLDPVLSGAPYCSSVSYKDPCCYNASDISICGPVDTKSNNFTKFLEENDISVTKFLEDLAVGNEETQNILITEFLDFALDKYLQ